MTSTTPVVPAAAIAAAVEAAMTAMIPVIVATLTAEAPALDVVAAPKAPAKRTRKTPTKGRTTRKTSTRKAAPKKPLSTDVAWTGTREDRKRWNKTLCTISRTSGIKVPGAGEHGTLYGFVTQIAWDEAEKARKGGSTPAQALDLLVDLSNEWLDSQNA